MHMNLVHTNASAVPDLISTVPSTAGVPLYVLVIFAVAASWVIFVLCYRLPRIMIIVFVLYTLLQDNLLYFAETSVPFLAELDLLDEVILLCLYCALLLRRPIRGVSQPDALSLLVICFMLLASFNAIRSKTPLPNLVLSFRDTLTYYFFYQVLMRQRPDEAYNRVLVLVILLFSVANTFVLLIQWTRHYTATGSFFPEDNAVGLMGPSGAHKLGYFSATLLLAYVGLARERVLRSVLWLVSLAACVIISSTEQYVLCVPGGHDHAVSEVLSQPAHGIPSTRHPRLGYGGAPIRASGPTSQLVGSCLWE